VRVDTNGCHAGRKRVTTRRGRLGGSQRAVSSAEAERSANGEDPSILALLTVRLPLRRYILRHG